MQYINVHAFLKIQSNRNKLTAPEDASTAKSRTGYVIRFAGCPTAWGSRLQTHIALSTTEAEYIALSTTMREVIPIINIINELRDRDLYQIRFEG